MKKMLIAVAVLLVFSVQAESQQRNNEQNIEIPLTAVLSKDLNISHKLKHKVALRYLHPQTQDLLFEESFTDVNILNDELALILGQGVSKKGSFKDALKNNPKLFLSVQIDDKQLYPNIGLLSPGHSRKSTMIAAGIKPSTGVEGKNSKSYDLVSITASTQAVVLSSKPRVQSQGDVVKTNPYQATVIGPVVSQPVRSLPLAVQQPLQPYEINKIRHENIFDKHGKRFGTQTDKVYDELALEPVSNLRGVTTPQLGVHFEGMGNLSGVAPPDTESAVGPNHYVQMVNLKLAVYDKSDGTFIQAPVDINTLWSGFGGACQSDNSGDPIALYDEQADRFVLTQFAVANGHQSVCFAISTTGDPTGTYNLYELQAQRFPDYFKVGVWPAVNNDMYTLTTNSGFQNQYDVYVLDRANMLAGNPARQAQFFQNYPNLLMPADNDGTPPVAGSPALLYTMRDGGESYFNNPATDSIDVYEFDVDWDTPANTSLTLAQSITPDNGGLTDFNWTICGFFQSSCLPQPVPGVLIDSGSWWPQQRLQYRNFGTYETLVGTWTVDVVPSGDRAAPRWFELRRAVGTTDWILRQEGTFSPDDSHRFSPSIAMDSSGNIGLAYSVTSDVINPSIRYTVHDVSTNTHGTMMPEAEMKTGTGVETSTNRWGDYASMDVDPADGCTFWFTSEYIASNGGFNWSTYIGSFKVPNCSNEAVVADETDIQVCNDVAPSADFDITLSDEFIATSNMAFSGCPANGVCDFSDNPVVAPNSNTVFSISDLSSVASGSYDMTVTATDSVDVDLNAVVALNLTVDAALESAPNLISPVNGGFSGSLTPMLAWDPLLGASSFVVEVDDDPTFSSIDFTGMTSAGVFDIDTTVLNEETCYFWRVTPSNTCGVGSSSAYAEFYTGQLSQGNDLMSDDVNITIPDNQVVTITSELDVAGVGFISDVNVKGLDISHTWIEDITVSLTSPQGTTVTVFSPMCGSNDDMDLNLDDEAPGSIPCPPTGGGTYKPANPLAAFDGEDADGVWILSVSDSFNLDGGTLNAWGLQFTTAVDTGDYCQVDVAPAAVSDVEMVDEDALTTTLDVLANDADPDGGLMEIIAVSQGDNGGTVVNNTSDVSYTPAADFCGLETFSYTLNGSSIGSVEVTVNCVNDEPSMVVNSAVYLGLDEIATPVSQNMACQFDFGAADENLSQAVNEMIVQVQNDPANILNSIDIDNTGAISYSFSGNSGMAEVTVMLQDDGGTAFSGDDTSEPYTFFVHVQDYVFRNGFDTNVCQ